MQERKEIKKISCKELKIFMTEEKKNLIDYAMKVVG